MRRTLYPHPEQEPHDAADNDEGWNLFLPRSPFNAFPTPPGHPRSRLKARFKSSLPPPSSSAASSRTPSSIPQTSKYSDIYSEFVQRYRSGRGVDGNPRDDPDFHFFQRGLDQLADAADSDEEDPAHAALASPGDHVDPSLAPGAEHNDSASIAEKERLDWQTMLASVLGGDVLKSEKTRIDGALDTSIDEQNAIHLNLWLGIRAKLHGRSVEEERRNLEERRLRIVDQIIEEVMNFRVDDCFKTHDSTAALKQVNAILRRVDSAQSLYPTLKSFYLDKSAAMDSGFQARCDTLNTWSTVLTSLRHQLALLRRWTGSETLDVTQPNTTAEMPICTHPARSVRNGQMEIADGTTFVERVLKEDSIQRTFEKGFLVTVHAFIGAARDAQVNLSALFGEMNLPTFERELVPLISFPTKLVQACLKLRLDYVQKLQDPDVLIIDQMTEDLTLNIGLACTLKRQYEVFLIPDPGGKWNLPQCISGDYDATILEALKIFFRLIHWKLKSGVKAIYFKETDVLEAQWATFNDVSLTAAGGSLLVAEQLWYAPVPSPISLFPVFLVACLLISILCSALTNKLMVRVTNYFESQVRVPSDNAKQRRAGREVNGEMSAFESHLTGGSFIHNQMSEEQMISWYSKILDSVRLRYRKLQRFAR
jgi:mitogen-activated protein kinase kinase kinase